MRSHPAKVFTLIPSLLEKSFGTTRSNFIPEPSVIIKCGRYRYFIELTVMWFIQTLWNAILIKFALLNLSDVEVHESETFIGSQFSLRWFDGPGKGQQVLERNDSTLVFRHLAEGVSHLFVCIHLWDSIFVCVSTASQLVVHFYC